jgi:hypothetical protein
MLLHGTCTKRRSRENRKKIRMHVHKLTAHKVHVMICKSDHKYDKQTSTNETEFFCVLINEVTL